MKHFAVKSCKTAIHACNKKKKTREKHDFLVIILPKYTKIIIYILTYIDIFARNLKYRF